MGTRTSDSCRARDLSALTALWWAWPASHRVAREGAGQARLVAVSQDNRRLLRSIAHAQRAPPFAAPGLEAPTTRRAVARVGRGPDDGPVLQFVRDGLSPAQLVSASQAVLTKMRVMNVGAHHGRLPIPLALTRQ